MRVLLMPASYPPVLGGLQVVSHTLARSLQERNHHVQVVTNRYPRALLAFEQVEGVPVNRLLLLHPGRYSLSQRPDLLLASLFAYPLERQRLARLVSDFAPDVVNVHFPDNQVPFVLWLHKHFAFRLVVSLHGHDVQKWFDSDYDASGAAFNRWERLLRTADHVTACSRHLLEQALTLVPEIAGKASVIHNGIDPQRFVAKHKHAHPRPYLLAYGRLTHKKGFDMLLDAWAQVVDELQDFDLVIAGSGEEELALRQRAQQMQLGERVVFFGRATPHEVIGLLNGSACVVVPSREEPFGIAALEALAAGKPLLATRVGGIPEFITEGPGQQLVEPNVSALANGLQQMSSSARMQQVPMPERSVLHTHSWQAVTKRYEAILQG